MSGNDGNATLNSTQKWKYVPGKVFNLVPLNLQEIRKQLLDSSSDESEDSKDDNENQDNMETSEENAVSEILNRSFDEGIPQTSPQKKTPLIDCSKEVQNQSNILANIQNGDNLGAKNYTEKSECTPAKKSVHIYSRNSLETVPESPSKQDILYSSDAKANNKNEKNTVPNKEPLNLSIDKKRNDSFDLDFSALSLHTPVKKVEKNFNYITPKINIIPPSATKSTCKSIPLFKTPLLKTPVNRTLIPTLYSEQRNRARPFSSHKKADLNGYIAGAEVYQSQNPGRRSGIYTADDRICVNGVEYIIMSVLGRGGSSEVFHGFNSEAKIEVAIKVVSLSNTSTADGYVNEVKLLESLQTCDRIIKMYDYEICDEKLIVVLEKGGEDLSTILKQLATKQSHLPRHMLFFYWMEMLYAVKQIHENGVIHSDLKPANFLRAEGGLKLIDFGIASKVQEDMTCVYKSNQEGSCNYISPEALNMQTNGDVDSPSFGKPKYKVHFKSDVWSLGCILYQLVYRKTPFQHINQIWAKLAAITNRNHKIEYPNADWAPPRILNTIKKCLQFDIKLRPSVDELISEYEQFFDNI